MCWWAMLALGVAGGRATSRYISRFDTFFRIPYLPKMEAATRRATSHPYAASAQRSNPCIGLATRARWSRCQKLGPGRYKHNIWAA